MIKKEIVIRYLLLVFSLFLIAFGVSLITKSTLGAAPISALAFVLSLFTSPSMGTYMLVVNGLLIIGQMLLLGIHGIREFRKELLLQIPVSVVFSVFVDLSLWMQSSIIPGNYFVCLLVLLAGAFVLASGIAIEVVANVAMNSGEYIVQIATRKFKKDFGTLKIINDITLVSLAIIAALLFSGGKLEGVREGTVIVACITGFIVRRISPFLNGLRCALDRMHAENETAAADETLETATTYPIITIARELGSGGNKVAEMLSKRLNIPYYDKEMIEMAAQESGLSEVHVRKSEQQVSNLLLFNMMQDYEAPIEKSLSRADTLFVAQCHIIRKLAAQGPCIIVGRLADYVMKENPQLLSVFLHADNEHKIMRVMERDNIERQQAIELIQQTNTARSNHYWHYTDKHWDDANHYSLAFDTGLLGLQRTTDIIASVYEKLAASNFKTALV